MPQSDSPTMLRESMKMFFSVAANEDFELRKINIRAAFLQAKQLDNMFQIYRNRCEESERRNKDFNGRLRRESRRDSDKGN